MSWIQGDQGSSPAPYLWGDLITGLCGSGRRLGGCGTKGGETWSEGDGGSVLLFALPSELAGSWHLFSFRRCAAQGLVQSRPQLGLKE